MMGGGTGQSRVDHSILTFLLEFSAEAVVLLQKITQMELTCSDCSPQVGDSPAGHGSRECQTLWTGNHNTCCTPCPACSALSVDD